MWGAGSGGGGGGQGGSGNRSEGQKFPLKGADSFLLELTLF